MSKWVMQAHFKHLHFSNFPMVWKTLRTIGFWSLQSLSKHSRVHRDSNSQHVNSLRIVRVFSFTLFCTPEGMIVRLPGLVLARTLAIPFALVTSPRLVLRHLKWIGYLHIKVFYKKPKPLQWLVVFFNKARNWF